MHGADETEKEILVSAPEPATGPGAWGQGSASGARGLESGARRPGLGFKDQIFEPEGVNLGPGALAFVAWGSVYFRLLATLP